MYTWATFYKLCREIRIYLIHATKEMCFVEGVLTAQL